MKGKISEDQIRQVSQLHKKCLDQGFLSRLGEGILSLIYSSLQDYPRGFLIIAVDNDKVTGFISCVESTADYYKWFLRRNFLKGSYLLLPYFFSIKKIRRILEVIFYPKKEKREDNLPVAELLTLGVDENYRKKGLAKELYLAAVEEFERRNIGSFRIIVGGALKPAQQFYSKMGAEKMRQIEVHQGENSWLFVQQVKKNINNCR